MSGLLHFSDVELEKLYQMMEENFPQVFRSSIKPKKKRQPGKMKGLVKLSADWDSDEVNKKSPVISMKARFSLKMIDRKCFAI